MRKRKPGAVFLRILNAVLGVIITVAFILMLTSFLSDRGVSILGVRSFIVTSGSMRPTFSEGAYLVTVTRPAGDIREGDIVTFRAPDGETMVTHRVIEIIRSADGPMFVTQGDDNNIEDRLPVTPDSIVGVAVFWVNGLGGLLLSLQNPMNFIFCLLLLVFVVFLLPELIRRRPSGRRMARKPASRQAPRSRAARKPAGRRLARKHASNRDKISEDTEEKEPEEGVDSQ